MRKTSRRVRRNLGWIATVLLLGGCAAEQGFQARGGDRVTAAASTSPAGEQVLKGFAEIALTDRPWSSFVEASANRVASVVDGSPLYVNIRAERPLGELALPADPNGRYTFSPYPHLVLSVGDDTSLRSLSTCYVTLSPAELGLRELVVPLAPATDRPGGNPTDCWLAVAASSRPGTRNYEIRLAGLAARTQSWLPVADLFAIESLEANYSDGTARYAAMLAAAPEPFASPSSPAASPSPAALLTPAALLPPAALPPPAAGLPAPGSEVVPVGTSGAAVSRLPEPRVPAPASVSSAARVEAPVAAPVAAPIAAPVAPPGPAPIAAPAPIIVATPVPASVATRPSQASRQSWGRIVIHHFERDLAAGARARDAKDVLAARTGFNVEVRPVTTPVSADNIRIFFEADRENAYAARDLVATGSPVRDFTDYRPLPRPGTIELWLAPR